MERKHRPRPVLPTPDEIAAAPRFAGLLIELQRPFSHDCTIERDIGWLILAGDCLPMPRGRFFIDGRLLVVPAVSKDEATLLVTAWRPVRHKPRRDVVAYPCAGRYGDALPGRCAQ